MCVGKGEEPRDLMAARRAPGLPEEVAARRVGECEYSHERAREQPSHSIRSDPRAPPALRPETHSALDSLGKNAHARWGALLEIGSSRTGFHRTNGEMKCYSC